MNQQTTMLIITILTVIGVVCYAVGLIGGWWNSNPFANMDSAGKKSRTCKRCGHQFHSVLECPRCQAIHTTTLTVEKVIRYDSRFDFLVRTIVSVCRVPEDAGDIMKVLLPESYLILQANVDGKDIMVLGKVVKAWMRDDILYVAHKMPHADPIGLLPSVARKAQETVGAKILIPVTVDGVKQ